MNENVQNLLFQCVLLCLATPRPGNTKVGGITVPLTSCLTALESAV
jgi:hypothetical protein